MLLGKARAVATPYINKIWLSSMHQQSPIYMHVKRGLYEHLMNINSAFNIISFFQLFTFLYPSNPEKCTLPM